MHNVLITIIRKKDNKIFRIGEGQLWRTVKGGLSDFGAYSPKITYEDNAVFDGGHINAIRLTKTTRTIKCAYLDLKNNAEARNDVLNFFRPKYEYKVYIKYGKNTRWADGVLSKFALNMDAKRISRLDMQMTFTFANPYLKSFDDFGKDIAMVTGKIAFPYMVKKQPGLTGGIFNFAKKVYLENDGDVDTMCRAVMMASDKVLNPVLLINDEYVRVFDEMDKGDVIEMDFTVLPPTVKKNGVNFIGHCDRTSSFSDMILNVGSNTVGFDADNGDADLSVSIYYNKLYSAI